jgi:hypothetical protein
VRSLELLEDVVVVEGVVVTEVTVDEGMLEEDEVLEMLVADEDDVDDNEDEVVEVTLEELVDGVEGDVVVETLDEDGARFSNEIGKLIIPLRPSVKLRELDQAST